VSHHVEPTGKVVETLSEANIKNATIRLKKRGKNGDISKSDTLANKVGAVEQVLVEDSHGLTHITLGLLESNSAGRNVKNERKNPSAGRTIDVLAEFHPLINKDLIHVGLTKKITATSKIFGSSTSGEESNITILKKRAFAKRMILRIQSSLLNFNTGILCSDKSTKAPAATINNRKLRHV